MTSGAGRGWPAASVRKAMISEASSGDVPASCCRGRAAQHAAARHLAVVAAVSQRAVVRAGDAQRIAEGVERNLACREREPACQRLDEEQPGRDQRELLLHPFRIAFTGGVSPIWGLNITAFASRETRLSRCGNVPPDPKGRRKAVPAQGSTASPALSLAWRAAGWFPNR